MRKTYSIYDNGKYKVCMTGTLWIYDSKEELVAEIGSAALVHHCGIETADSFHNSAAYVQNWLTALKNDKRFIVSAAGKADKAVNFILTGA